MQEYDKGEKCGLGSRLAYITAYSMNDLPLDCYLKTSLLLLSVLEDAIFIRSVCEQERDSMPHK